MFWIIAGSVAFVALLAAAFYFYVSDRKYEKKKTSEVFSPPLRKEIEAERAEGLRRREKFAEAMKDASRPPERRTDGE